MSLVFANDIPPGLNVCCNCGNPGDCRDNEPDYLCMYCNTCLALKGFEIKAFNDKNCCVSCDLEFKEDRC